MEIDDIIEKIVTNNLGGYCYEHNKLLHDALLSLGYDVRISMARVINNQNQNAPRTHRVTLLKIEEKEYLIDVGFGAMTPTTPLEITSTELVNNSYKISHDKNNNFTLEISTEENFTALYQFNLDIYTEADCEMGNFYSQYHQEATFQNNFVVSRQLKDQTLSFINNSYHQITDTFTNILHIIEPKNLKKILEEDFDIKISKKESKILFEKAQNFRIA